MTPAAERKGDRLLRHQSGKTLAIAAVIGDVIPFGNLGREEVPSWLFPVERLPSAEQGLAWVSTLT